MAFRKAPFAPSTDVIKDLLVNAKHFGGKTEDWTLEKTESDKTSVTCFFNNAATGQAVEALEIRSRKAIYEHGLSSIAAKMLNALSKIEQEYSETYETNSSLFIFTETKGSKFNLTFKTAIETDAEKNAAADQVIELLMKDGSLTYALKDEEAENLLKKAGTQAVANRILFAYAPDDPNGERWWLNLEQEFLKNDCCYDGHIPIVPPYFTLIRDGQYECRSKKSPQEIADDLMKMGFKYDKKFQKFVDSFDGGDWAEKLVPETPGNAPEAPSLTK